MVSKDELMQVIGTDFHKFLFDNFNSTESLAITKTGTAIETKKLMELKLASGVMANSSIKAVYNYNIFNCVYAKAFFHLNLSSMANVFAFFGFKESSNAPESIMTENHSGIMVENGKMYFCTGYKRGAIEKQQKVQILGLDMTRDNLYLIEHNKLSTFPFPYYIPYLDSFRIITPDRIWTLRQSNDTAKPDDTSYFIVFYLRNTTGADKYFRIKKFIYGEEWAD